MEESFPRGGKGSASNKDHDGSMAAKRKRFDSISVGPGGKRKVTSRRSASPDPSAALWTGKLRQEICIPDLLVLGCVRSITDQNVILELPDGMRGRLSMTSISSILTEQLLLRHQRETAPNAPLVKSNSTSDVDFRLRDYFTPGQLICCKITTIGQNAEISKKKRRQTQFTVTTDPKYVNALLDFGSITNGMVLNAAVRSVEEKGYLLDLGIASTSPDTVAFLPFDRCKNFGRTDASKNYRVGQVISCAVIDAPSTETASAKCVIRLSTLPSHLNGTSHFLERHMRKEYFPPGLVLKAVIDKVLPKRGLVVHMAKPGGGFWRGFVSKWRLPNRLMQPTDYKPKQNLKVAVLYTIVNSTVFGLSAETHLTARAADENGRMDLLNSARVGDLAHGKITMCTSKGVVFFELGPTRKDQTTLIFAKALRFQLENMESPGEFDAKYAIGTKHQFRIVGYSLMDRLLYADARKEHFKQPIVNVESSVPGTLVEATVWKAMDDKGIFVRLYDHINGYVPLLHCVNGPFAAGTKIHLDQKFPSGRTVKARILYPDVDKNRLVLTLKKPMVASPMHTFVNGFNADFIGHQTDGFIAHINAERGVLVAFYGHARGWLPKSDLEKSGLVRSNQRLTEVFHLGQTIRVQIMQVDVAGERMQLKYVASDDSPVIKEIKTETNDVEFQDIKPDIKRDTKFKLVTKKCALAVGKLFTAIITKVQKLQLDVMIEQRHPGRVFVTELSDDFIHGSMPLEKYAVGQAILVKVIGIRTKRVKTRRTKAESKNEVLGADSAIVKKTIYFAECTMKESKMKAKSGKKRLVGYKEEFRKGERVAVAVEEITSKDNRGYSCHVAATPAWKGVIPILDLSADFELLRNPLDRFIPGEILIARVVGVQAKEKHLQLTCLRQQDTVVSLGLATKAVVLRVDTQRGGVKCRMIDGTRGFLIDDESDTETEVGHILKVRPIGKTSGGRWKLSTKISQSASKKNELTFESVVSKRVRNGSDDDVKPILTEEATAVSSAMKKMEEAATFSWDSGRFSMANLMNLCLDDNRDPGNEKKERSERKTRPKSTFQREKLEEEDLLQKEMALLDPDSQLQTMDDFDRLVMGSPDSSVIWIRYMAYFLQRKDVEKAKAVAERALKTINVREQNERFNIWTALLNLENAYGTIESFRQTLDKALAVNDPLRIYHLGTKILKKSNKLHDCDALYNEMLAKFKSEFNVWIWFGDYCMATSRPDKARDLMKRAMKSLPQSRHVDLVSRFAQLEYRYSADTDKTKAVGDPERGRTLFENVLRDCPKRTDIWSVYIDMTSKFQGIEEARPIFERVTSLKLNIHNMRLFYKKWLELEERLGTSETLAQVKKRAAEYVQGSLAALPSMEAYEEDRDDDADIISD